MANEECGFLDVGCKSGNLVQGLVGGAIENLANAVMEAYGKAMGSLGTLWVNIGTPNLTGSGSESSSIKAGSSAPASGNITMVLSYVTWLGFVIAVISLFVLGAMIATRIRSGEGVAAVGKVGIVLVAVVFITGASSLISVLLSSGPTNAGGAVLYLQSSLWWYMGGLAVMSVIVGGIRMAWEQRAEPGLDTIKSVITLVVVAGAGVTIVSLLVAAADSFSVWIINGSLDCDVAKGSACFGKNMMALTALGTNPATGSLGAILIILLGLVAIFASMVQIVLMVARGGMLVILTGILPLSASFTNTEAGKSWFRKCLGWLIAFILYKPAAAIVYAAAFQLAGTKVFTDDGSGLVAVLTGLMLMMIALFAMPALMRFVTPLVSATVGGAAGGALGAGAALAVLPTGAAAVGRLGSGGSSGSDGQPGPQGPTGSGTSAMTATKSIGSAGTGAGAASAGAGAGSGAAAGAGAAAGPVGLAVGAAMGAGKKAKAAAQSIGDQSTGEGGGPDGSQ